MKGHRGNSLEGLVLGLSRDNAYVLCGLEVVRVSRGEPAFSALDEASALNLVGKRLHLVIRKGRAAECTPVTGVTGHLAELGWAAVQGLYGFAVSILLFVESRL